MDLKFNWGVDYVKTFRPDSRETTVLGNCMIHVVCLG